MADILSEYTNSHYKEFCFYVTGVTSLARKTTYCRVCQARNFFQSSESECNLADNNGPEEAGYNRKHQTHKPSQ